MSKLLSVLQERKNVWVEMNDLRGKRNQETLRFEDPVQQEHLDKLNKRFTELNEIKMTLETEEAQMRAMAERDAEQREKDRDAGKTEKPEVDYDSSFWRWASSPFGQDMLGEAEKRMLETRGTSTQIGTTNSLGGYTIPESFSNILETNMKWYGGMLGNIGMMNDTIGGQLKYPSLDDTASVGAPIGQGVATTVGDLTFGNVLFGEYTIDSKIIKMSNELVNDNRVGLVQQILGDLLPERLGRAANSYLTNGTGLSQPFGLTRVGLSSALTTAGATAITKAELIKALYKVDIAYRTNPRSAWMMHDSILGYLRTLDIGNTDTVQIFAPSIIAGQPDRLLGLPVVINNDLEAANASTGLPVTAKKHIYFGDFSKFVMRRIGGVSLTRNESLYWAERSVGFMGYMRFDSNLINANAIKFITQA